MENKKTGSPVLLTFRRTLIYFILVCLLILTLFPIYMMFINATRPTADINKGVSLLPGNFLEENFRTINEKTLDTTFFRGFLNSMFLSSSITLLTCYFSAMTAYGLHVYKFRGNRLIVGSIMALIMIPPQLSMVGFLQFIGSMRLVGTYIPLIIPAIASPMAVFFFLQYLKSTVQVDLINAARIDGAHELSIFHQIVLPIILPGLAVQAIFTFVGSWNNFLMPFLVLGGNPKNFTMPMMAQQIRLGLYVQDTGAVNMALMVTVIPLFVVYAFLSRYIIAGVALGGVKE